uniref:Subfamily A1A unassigned peptidase (A01 family) n=1 Tax=Schistosoma mansoni TaxID=6183 RepID=A0A5K4F8Q9_SCHMA
MYQWNNRNTSTTEQPINFENFQYYGEISVGTPPQKLRVLFDTESTDTWFASRNCWFLDIFCWMFPFYDSSKSSTYVADGSSYLVSYLDSNFSGFWSVDTIRIGSLVIRNQAFAEMRNIFNLDYYNCKYDGIIGMSSRRISEYGNIPMFPNILANGVNMDPIFSFYLNRKSGSAIGGELVLGGFNPQYFKGDFEYIPTVHNYMWVIQMLRYLRINGVELCNICSALIDTGTSLILGPPEQVRQINSLLGTNDYFGRKSLDCGRIDMLPSIELIFHRKKYILKPRHYVVKKTPLFLKICVSPFEPHPSLSPNYWILGDVFMRRIYTVFDFGQRRIGLADAVGA